MTLKPVANDTRGKGYCGPHVIAAVTGQPLSVVLTAIRRARYGSRYDGFEKRPAVRGLGPSEMQRALRLLGYSAGRWSSYSHAKPTLSQWLRQRTDEQLNSPMIINVTNHWVVVKGYRFIDTMTKGKPVHIEEAPGLRKRVEATYLVQKLRDVSLAELDALESTRVRAIESYRAETRKGDSKDRAALKKLGKVRTYRDGPLSYAVINFDPPINGIREIETMHYDWAETLSRVNLGLDNPNAFDRDEEDRGRIYVSL